jgi:2-phospho-L-lactate guanylyltransferase
LSELLLWNTLGVLKKSSVLSQIVIVSSDDRAEKIARISDVECLREDSDRGVNAAISRADDYSCEMGADATIVIPQDLPLLTNSAVDMICRRAEGQERSLVICPSIRYDGSNALLRKPSDLMRTFYENDSFNAHLRLAKELKIVLNIFLSDRIMIDLDTIEDVRILVQRGTANGPVAYLKSKARDALIARTRMMRRHIK